MRDSLKELHKAMVFIEVVIKQSLGFVMQISRGRSMLPVLEVGLGVELEPRTGQ